MILNSDVIQVWVYGIMVGIGLGTMLYIIGYAIGLLYRIMKS